MRKITVLVLLATFAAAIAVDAQTHIYRVSNVQMGFENSESGLWTQDDQSTAYTHIIMSDSESGGTSLSFFSSSMDYNHKYLMTPIRDDGAGQYVYEVVRVSPHGPMWQQVIITNQGGGATEFVLKNASDKWNGKIFMVYSTRETKSREGLDDFFNTAIGYYDPFIVDVDDYDDDDPCDGSLCVIDGLQYSISGRNVAVVGYSTTATDIVIPSEVIIHGKGYPVTTIGDQSFRDFNGLRSVVLPNTITSIESNAFRHCINLETITIPSSVEKIGLGPFSECRSLASIMVEKGNKYFVSVDGILYNTEKTKIVHYPANKAGKTFVIPSTVETIEYGSFSNVRNLVSVTIPNSVKSIEWWAFPGCGSLRSVEIPSSVSNIGQGAFSYCRQLEAVYIPQTVTQIGDRAFLTCPKLTIYSEAASEPEGWLRPYDPETVKVVWNSNRNDFRRVQKKMK
ncbi:MAG: leucine-rich repeat domain-containing protein [Bacteroidales bacterium]|nr:leucine-rich repeat domain-containing protein [Bacteroidales bacterium]